MQPNPDHSGIHRANDSSSEVRISIVGVGASAGGLEALQEFFRNVPPQSGIGFVVVVHQHPDHVSMLPQLLGLETEMPVMEATDGSTIEADHVYIAPSRGQLAIMDGVLQKMKYNEGDRPKLPIDYFFRSLAEDQKENAIGIILSGTGSDGSVGLKAIKAEAGMVIVQQPETAKFGGMPSSAIATGMVDYILPPHEMPDRLVAYVNRAFAGSKGFDEPVPELPEGMLQKILILLRKETGHDFSNYKRNTLRRRIERRMQIHQIEGPNEYLKYLQANSSELRLLFKELLISVTSFFRDPEAWEALEKTLRETIRVIAPEEKLRCWVPGSATGEEAYSLAILLAELQDKIERRLDVQIFGTDLDSDAVDFARQGVFPKGIAVDVSPERLKRFFVREGETYRIKKQIREQIVFSTQNVISDPPFIRLGLVSCRNLMIYLNAELQAKLLNIFHYALNPHGLLFLGPSETGGTTTELFQPIDRRWKIFRREQSPSPHALPKLSHSNEKKRQSSVQVSSSSSDYVKKPHISTVIERILMDRFVPTTIVVDESGEIFYIYGRTGNYLEPVEGEPQNNILEMAREGLRHELSSALRECATRKVQVARESIRVKNNGGFVHINISVEMIHRPDLLTGLMMVVFHPVRLPPPEGETAKRPQASDTESLRNQNLKQELRYLKESYRATQEELETSNEELKSTNEELQSTNEELQSSNEELETSKEEMESLNEELSVVNSELNAKVEKLGNANDDMQNLLNNTQIGTLFLDNELRIKRFTMQIQQILKIRESDQGRPVSDLVSTLQGVDFTQECREVLDTLAAKETQVQTQDGAHFLMRINPYRTRDNAIRGLVVTFVEISRLVRAENNVEFFSSIVQAIRHPLVVLDAEFEVVAVNDQFCQTFHVNRQETVGTKLFDLGDGQWDISDLHRLLEEILPRDSHFTDYEVKCEFPEIGTHKFLLNAKRLEQSGTLPPLILLGIEKADR